MGLFDHVLVVVRGGGDLASGVIYRLCRAGFPVIVTELETPFLIRRRVSYGEAVLSGEITVEGIRACHVEAAPDTIREAFQRGIVPVLIDPRAEIIKKMTPVVVVDARMKKVNPDTTIHDAPLVIALGPGYTAGVDCHAVVETNRGHRLGRVIVQGTAETDTGVPGQVEDHTVLRVLRAPAGGCVQTNGVEIGDFVKSGQVIASVTGQPVIAPFDGVLRGLIHERVPVIVGEKIGDVDPRARRENCFTISDKALAVGGGALEAVLVSPQVQAYLSS